MNNLQQICHTTYRGVGRKRKRNYESFEDLSKTEFHEIVEKLLWNAFGLLPEYHINFNFYPDENKVIIQGAAFNGSPRQVRIEQMAKFFNSIETLFMPEHEEQLADVISTDVWGFKAVYTNPDVVKALTAIKEIQPNPSRSKWYTYRPEVKQYKIPDYIKLDS